MLPPVALLLCRLDRCIWSRLSFTILLWKGMSTAPNRRFCDARQCINLGKALRISVVDSAVGIGGHPRLSPGSHRIGVSPRAHPLGSLSIDDKA